jgi:hypothetical protein
MNSLVLGLALVTPGHPPRHLPPPPPVVVESAPKRVYVERPVRRVYVEERPVEETCVVQRERVWVPGWGWEVRRRTVCD